MDTTSFTGLRKLCGASLLALSLGAASLNMTVTAAEAEVIFNQSADAFTGNVRASAAEQGKPILAGSPIVIEGQGLIPGQKITLMRGNTILNEGGPLTVGADGSFTFKLTLEQAAVPGLHQIVVIADQPAAASLVQLKISPELPLLGADLFDITSADVTQGLYQLAVDHENGAVFVTSAVGRPPVTQSALTKLDAKTLEVLAQITPAPSPEPEQKNPNAAGADAKDSAPALYAVYGLAYDPATGYLWATNTRQDTISVYKAEDLSLVKQFPPNSVDHPFSVMVDSAAERIYVTQANSPLIDVFNAKTLEKLEPYEISSSIRGETFSNQIASFDAQSGLLIAASNRTPELAVIDTKTGEIRVTALPGIGGTSTAYDAVENLIFVASQQTDNVLIIDGATGEVLHDVDTGAGALYLTFDPVSRLAFVGNRGAGTLTAITTKGEIKANLDIGGMPNHLSADGKGNVWAVNKGKDGDKIWRLTPKAQ